MLFLAYSGDLQWRTRAGDEIAARLGEPLTKDLTAQALRTALDPAGSWIPQVLAAADRRLTEVRRHVPDAGGLVIATDQDSARVYAKLLRDIAGEAPVVVLSDEKTGSRKIAEFAEGDARWMVAVRMVSEGVDIPRLAVGVYATTTSTPLFFAQAVGRFVRARARGESASVFLPSVPQLLEYAAEMEVQRDHVLGRKITDEADIFAAERDLLAQAQAGESASSEQEGLPFEALGSEARFDRVLYDGGEFGHEGEVHLGSEEEMDFLGIPGLLDPGQMKELLAQRQSDRAKSRRKRDTGSRDGRRSPPTSSSPRCVASSTGWSRRGTTAPARRTASPTPRCARSAADLRPRSRTPTSCGPGSTCSASGRSGVRPRGSWRCGG